MSVNTLTNDGMHRHSLLPGHAWAIHEGFVNPGDLISLAEALWQSLALGRSGDPEA